MAAPTKRSSLRTLTRSRLIEVAEGSGVEVSDRAIGASMIQGISCTSARAD